MDLGRLYQELLAAARKLGIDVRSESFDPGLSEGSRPRGGLCVVNGKGLILVDARGALPDRIATVAGALSRVDIDGIYLPPIVRATIGAYREDGSEVELLFRRAQARRKLREPKP